MEIGKAFTFVREDEAWIKKLAIGGGLILVSTLFGALLLPLVVLLFVIGYQIAIVRNVIDGSERPLPEWGNWGELFMDGVVVFVAIFVYTLPAILLSVCGVAIALATADPGGQMSGAGTAAIVVFSCLTIFLAIALAFVVPALYIQYARAGDFGAMFRFGEVIAVARQNLVPILLIVLATWVANLVVSLVGAISAITICGPLIVIPAGSAWILYATAHLYGQIGRNMADKSLEGSYSPA